MADQIDTVGMSNNKLSEDIENATRDETEDDVTIADDNFCSGDPVGNTALELADSYEYKRKELDKIHQDLNELMDRLNSFIADQDDCYESDEEIVSKQYAEDISEKQDGPQEKELIKQKYYKGIAPEDIYVTDGDNPPEVDWETLAPFIQSVVGDLKKIRQLNQMTNSVMERIRCLTGKGDNYQEDEHEN